MKAFNLEQAKKGRCVCTRDGHEVQILDYDYKCHYFSNNVTRQTIVGKVKLDDGEEELRVWSLDGFIHEDKSPHEFDLFLSRERCKGWINIFRTDSITYSGSTIYLTKEEAENGKGNECVDTIEIKWKD